MVKLIFQLAQLVAQSSTITHIGKWVAHIAIYMAISFHLSFNFCTPDYLYIFHEMYVILNLYNIYFQAVFSFVVANNLNVRPTCTYVQHYIDKNKPTEIMQRLEK